VNEGEEAPATVAKACAEIAFAYESQSMWQRHMTSCGLRPGDIKTDADIRRIRPTTKADYRRDFPSGVLAHGVSMTGPGVFRSQSAGTSGDRLSTLASTGALADRMYRTLAVHPLLRGELTSIVKQRPVRYAPPNCSDVECATPRTAMADRVLSDGTLVLPVAHDLLATPPALVDQAIAEMTGWSPSWIYADPTHLAFLARAHTHRDLAAPATCRAVILTYSQCTSVARRQIAALLPNVFTAEVVSMSEFGWLGMECPLGALHLNDASFYLELVVDGRPAEIGEVADLYVTSLGDRICPHIRYHTGDVYRLLDPCSCGHSYPAVRFEGRRKDLVVRGGSAVLTPKTLDQLLQFDWIDIYRLAQLDDRHFDFRYTSNATCPPDGESVIRDILTGYLGADAELRIQDTDYIPSERSGKFLSCVSAPARRFAENGQRVPVPS
jgi:phenylacetate-CoA ligase